MKQVVFIQGAGEGAHEADGEIVAALQKALGSEYHIHYPKMPEDDSAGYTGWKAQIAKALAPLDDSVILVGHSFGGSELLKYLSEDKVSAQLAGVFLLAPPFWGAPDWDYDEPKLREGFAAKLPKGVPLFIYHSRDDEEVAFTHLGMYAEKLPQATVRELDGYGHQFKGDLSPLVADIASVQQPAPR